MQDLREQLELKLHRFHDPITLSDPSMPGNPFVLVNAPFASLVGMPACELVGLACDRVQEDSGGAILSHFVDLDVPDGEPPLTVGFHCLRSQLKLAEDDGASAPRNDARARAQQAVRRSRENRWQTAATILTLEVHRFVRNRYRLRVLCAAGAPFSERLPAEAALGRA